jgi:hypothetical protein
MAEATTEPLLDLFTQITRPVIKIDGEFHEIFSPDELSVIQNHRFIRWGERIRALQQQDGEEAAKEQDQLVDLAARAVLVDVGDDLFAKLSGQHKLAIVEVFTALLLRSAAQVAGAMHRAAGTTPEFPLPGQTQSGVIQTGDASCRGWCGSITSALASCWKSFLRLWSRA